MRNFVAAIVCTVALAGCSHTETSPWEGKLIQGPGTSPEAQKVYLVRQGRRHWVAHAQWIVAHGYKWPGDVNFVTTSDMDAIPLAEPILSLK